MTDAKDTTSEAEGPTTKAGIDDDAIMPIVPVLPTAPAPTTLREDGLVDGDSVGDDPLPDPVIPDWPNYDIPPEPGPDDPPPDISPPPPDPVTPDELKALTYAFENITGPAWGDEANTYYRCKVDFPNTTPPIVQCDYVAMADDVEAHGRAIFQFIASGQAGEVAPYAATSAEVNGEYAERFARVSTDITMLAEALEFGMARAGDDKRLEALRRYRLALYQMDRSNPATAVFPPLPDGYQK